MKKFISIITLVIIAICFISCSDKTTDVYAENTELDRVVEENNESKEENKVAPDVIFGDYKVYGSSTAIISFTIKDNVDFDLEQVDVSICKQEDMEKTTVSAELFDGIYYARLENLLDDSIYNVSVTLVNLENNIELETDYSFFTPKRSISLDEVQRKIDEELIDYKYSDKDNVLCQTQACLSLLGFEVGKLGRFNDIAQANLCRFEYSVNKLNDYVYYDNILAWPNEKTLTILKDILTVDINTDKDEILQVFTANNFPLSEYAMIDEEGGKIDIESYILQEIDSNIELNNIYLEYPFEIDTPQFKEKYAEYFSGDILDEQYEQKLKQYAAKNKVLFSYYAQDILRELAKPKQRLIYFYNDEACATYDTMIAYSYMFIDALEKTGLHFEISTAYRDYDFQWLLYSQKIGMSVAKNRNANWHYRRQELSYVPGFSNHQYGVSIDFHERTTFGQTKLYNYLLEHGEEFGFYNYNIEPWHWSYLGNLDYQ